MAANEERTLSLRVHGRILDHLGLQMYQSPVAALAEMISNSWDADAENVKIAFPTKITPEAKIVIEDDGHGMTFDECQKRYLEVGAARRADNPDEKSRGKNRPILGRKGIGKFAGFGIAKVIQVETVSDANGEKTLFEMDFEKLRTQEYVESNGGEVDVIDYQKPSTQRKKKHGTKVILRNLCLKLRPNSDRFRESMARRFLLHTRTHDFEVRVDGELIPDSDDIGGIEFTFPKDYEKHQRPSEMTVEEGWGIEKVDDHLIRWRIVFYHDTIGEEELRGVTIFAKLKMAQSPFFFNLTGGLGGQHGQQYLSGQVEADFLDLFDQDLISPERQRVNWELAEAEPLLRWGQSRVKQLLRIWKERRAKAKQKILEDKVSTFSQRLGKLEKHEQNTIRQALKKLAGVTSLNNEQFATIGGAILTAWEGGRLRDLIDEVARTKEMSEETLLKVLLEMNVITALHTAEAVRAKLNVIAGLNDRIKEKELENDIRDYIAKNPWLLDPEWETFVKETRVKHVIAKAAKEAKLDDFEDWKKRIDLVLSSSQTLLIVEFIRPGKPLDYDHLSRFAFYMTAVSSQLKAESGTKFSRVVGYLVADKLDRTPTFVEALAEHRNQERYALSWPGLLSRAAAQWKDFLKVLLDRSPNDTRLRDLAKDLDLD